MAFGRGKRGGDDEAPKKRGRFSRKGKEDVESAEDMADEVVSTPSRNEGKQRKRNKNDMMASVLRETVKTTVLADMKANERFQVERGGDKYYVGWLLDVADIGGLSKRMTKDEAKGSIIEGINRGSIKVLITSALMAEEKLCFVPDADTLDMMGEYSILAKAPYKTMFILAPDGDVINLDGAVDVSLADAFKVIQGDVTMQQLLADYGCYWAEGAHPIEEFTADDMVVGVPDEDLVDEDAAIAVPPMSAQPTGPIQAPPPEAGLDGLDDFDFDEFELDEQSANAADIARQAQQSTFERPIEQQQAPAPVPAVQQAPAEAEEELSAEDYRRGLARTWYSTDLNLELDMGAFEDHFGADTVYALFDDSRPTEGSWMGEYLNQMSREANDDIRAMHQAHVSQLRERYQRMMSNYISALGSALAMNVDLAEGDPLPNTYAEEFEVLKRTRIEKGSEIEILAQKERARIDEAYERRRTSQMEAAANRRGQEFDQRYGPDNDRKKANVETRLRADFDDEYNEGWRRLNDRRVEEAARRMDYGITAIIADLSEQYKQMMDAEAERYEMHRKAIADWIDENRRQDIDFVAATLEEQRQMEKSEVISREMSERMRQQQQEFEARKASLEADIVALRKRNEDALNEAKSAHDRAMAEIEQDNDRLRKREADLLDRYKNLDEEKSMEYGKRMKELEDQLEAERLRYDALMSQGKRSNIVWIAFIVVSAIAAGCVGTVFGLHQSIDYSMAANTASMVIPMLPPLF